MDQLLQATVSGLVLGSLYAMMTVGLTLIYGVLRTLNLAHGMLIMLAGYAAWMVVDQAHLPIFVGLLAAAASMFVLGLVINRVAILPIVGRQGFEVGVFIATMGVAIVGQNLALIAFSGRVKGIPPLLEGQVVLPYSVTVTNHQILTAVIAVGSLMLLQLFLTRSRQGLGIGAVAQNLNAARLMSINASAVYNLTTGLSAALAGVAGVVLASVFFITPVSGVLPLFKALIVSILGGLGSIRGTIAAAFIVGLIEALSSLYVGAKYSLPVLFLLVMIMLSIRPHGLFGQPEETRL